MKIYGFTLKRICDLQVGDKVAVYTEGVRQSKISQIHPEPVKFEEVYKIEDGEPYFRPYGFVRVGGLQDRDEVMVLVELDIHTIATARE